MGGWMPFDPKNVGGKNLFVCTSRAQTTPVTLTWITIGMNDDSIDDLIEQTLIATTLFIKGRSMQVKGLSTMGPISNNYETWSVTRIYLHSQMIRF